MTSTTPGRNMKTAIEALALEICYTSCPKWDERFERRGASHIPRCQNRGCVDGADKSCQLRSRYERILEKWPYVDVFNKAMLTQDRTQTSLSLVHQRHFAASLFGASHVIGLKLAQNSAVRMWDPNGKLTKKYFLA